MKTADLVALLAADNRTAAARSWRDWSLGWSGLALAGLLTGGAFLILVGARPNLIGAEIALVVARKEGVALAAAIGGLWAALLLLRPAGRGARARGFMLLPLAIAAGLGMWDIALTGAAGWADRMIGVSGWRCLLTIPAIAALPLLALIGLLRLGAPPDAGLAGAAAGLAAAGFAASIYALHCVEDSPLFVLLWYSAAAMIVAFAGAMIGRRALRW